MAKAASTASSSSSSASSSPATASVVAESPARSPGRPKDGSLTSRRQEEIIVAASRVFAERGYRTSDLNQVAEVLGVAKGTIYNYFSSKDELFLACVQYGRSGFKQAHQRGVESVADSDALAKIKGAMHAYFEFFDQNPQHIELMMQARSEFKENNLLEVKAAISEEGDQECERFAPLMQLLEEGVKAGLIKPLGVKNMHDALFNLVVGAIFSRHYGKDSLPLAAQAADVFEIVFSGIQQNPVSWGAK